MAAAKENEAKDGEKGDLVRLVHESDKGSFVLTIGKTRYDVTDGVVDVAPEHVEAAQQAGFR